MCKILSLNLQVRTEINKEIEAVSKAADPLKILASADTMKVLGVQRPVLQVRNLEPFKNTEALSTKAVFCPTSQSTSNQHFLLLRKNS